MVALDLAVGLGPVGPGSLVPGAAGGQGCGERPGAVAGAVVGQDSSDPADAVAVEELQRPGPEPGGSGTLLVG